MNPQKAKQATDYAGHSSSAPPHRIPRDLPGGCIVVLTMLVISILIPGFSRQLNSYTADKYDGLMAQRLQVASYFWLGRDVRVFVIFLGAVLNQPLVTLGVVALVMNVEVVRRIVICRHAPVA